jgi:transposase
VARERTPMRKIREVLRLKWLGRSHREIALSCAIGYGTVGEYLRRAKEVSWAQVEAMDDGELERALYPPPPGDDALRQTPDWSHVYQELKRPGVTLLLLWEEYRAAHAEGYGYSWFCEQYRAYERTLDATLRQEYKAGELMLVDYAGQTIAVRDSETGESREAHLFVACLGASQYIYVEATWGQTLPEWIQAHVGALEFFGGATEILVPDNTKTGVKSPCRYEPELNPTYAEMARHYGLAVIPTRVRRPRDKAKVENAVLQAERWILARLRHRTFFSLAELNRAARELVVALNERRRKDLGVSRRELYEKLDRPALRPLPAERYRFAAWKKVRVGPDYHVELERHYYSVPYQLIGQELDLRASSHTVEIFHKARSIARHQRSRSHGHTTVAEHMPKRHRKYLEWTPERLVRWARQSGEATAAVVTTILESRPHPQQGFRSCLGLLSLERQYDAQRLEAACRRALEIKSPSYRSVRSILRAGLDRRPVVAEEVTATQRVRNHDVRGAAYYQQGLP